LRELEAQFIDLGVAVRFVVIGDAAKAADFCGKQGMADRCIPDPDKATYIAMGLEKYNLLRLFSDKALIARRKENKAAGFSQDWGNTKLKDAAQLPGAAFIDAHGIVRWTYEGKHPGDLPTMSAMLQTIRDLSRN
jgi:hypothetical protein